MPVQALGLVAVLKETMPGGMEERGHECWEAMASALLALSSRFWAQWQQGAGVACIPREQGVGGTQGAAAVEQQQQQQQQRRLRAQNLRNDLYRVVFDLRHPGKHQQDDTGRLRHWCTLSRIMQQCVYVGMWGLAEEAASALLPCLQQVRKADEEQAGQQAAQQQAGNLQPLEQQGVPAASYCSQLAAAACATLQYAVQVVPSPADAQCLADACDKVARLLAAMAATWPELACSALLGGSLVRNTMVQLAAAVAEMETVPEAAAGPGGAADAGAGECELSAAPLERRAHVLSALLQLQDVLGLGQALLQAGGLAVLDRLKQMRGCWFLETFACHNCCG
jgi:hypothetical protein